MKPDKLKILVFDADQKHSLGIVRHLGKKGYIVHALTYTKCCLSSWSKYCDKEIYIPFHDKFDEILIDTIQLEQYDILMPVGTTSYKFCNRLRDKIISETNAKLLLAPSKSFHTAMSKELTLSLAESIGIQTPKTIIPTTDINFAEVISELGCQVVIKARHELGINVVEYANGTDELTTKFKLLNKKYKFTENDLPIIQSFISGYGVGFFGFFINGKCHQSYQHKRIREYPVTGGMSTCCELFYNEKVEQNSLKLLEYLNWTGVAMVEYKIDKSGDPILMEINPKFWGSHDLALACGIDFPQKIIDYLRGDYEQNKNYLSSGTKRFHWPLHGDVQHIMSKPSNIFNFVKDLFDKNVENNIHLREDFWGTVGIAINLIQKLFRKLNKTVMKL